MNAVGHRRIDIFAVNQNFTGDFTKHPDGNFPSVIRNSEGVVFTMFPWNAPIAPKRIWCEGARQAGRARGRQGGH